MQPTWKASASGGFLLIHIFAAGTISSRDKIRIEGNPKCKIIAADGGARHCLGMKLIPDFIIGDFDSLSEQETSYFINAGTKLIQYPIRKDFTDLELAIRLACEEGADEIRIYGALGLRWDQTLANLMLLASSDFGSIPMRIIDGNQEIFLIHPNETVEIRGDQGDTVSLIPIGGSVHRIKTQGLEYQLNNETLDFGKSRGVSNVLIENPATIKIESGALICTIIHHLKDEDKKEGSA